jgi:CRISPR-associated protein Csb2
MTHLVLTVRFLDNRYHGLLGKSGPAEWPPSPFRLFQALVAGVARRGELVFGDDVPSNTRFTPIGQALGWLQRHTRDHPPVIITPKSKTGQAITRFVPNNDGDKKLERQERLAAKPTIPTLFLLDSDQRPEVHYIWNIGIITDAPLDGIRDAARSLTTLGWGVDMAFADARSATEAELQQLNGVRWYPKKDARRDDGSLRTPTYDDETNERTLCDLRHCHEACMNRIEHGKPLKTVDKPRIFDRVLYTSVERPMGRPRRVLRLVDENEEACRLPHAKLVHVAGMLRHVAIEAMTRNPPPFVSGPEWVNRVVRGKRDDSATDEHKQFSYVPLPSIGYTHSDAMIRNVMIVAPLGMERELNYLAEQLNGQTLEPEGEVESQKTDSKPDVSKRVELHRFTPPSGKFIADRYLGSSRVWHTVTPVILDGHNDKKAEKTIKLIQAALERAGIEAPCEFTWQSIPFLKNCLSAHKYDRDGRHTGYHRPAHLKDLTAVHVRLTFDYHVPGPLTIGAGRHCGFGLFASPADGS